MREKIEAILSESSATFGIAIKHLEKNEEFEINGNKPFQMASVFKIPILAALMDEVTQNKLSLSERITLKANDRVPGSGVFKEFDEGATVTIKDLAMLMIIVSDNMATDKILSIVGKDKVNAYMNELGLDQIIVHDSCWELLASCIGVNPEPYSVEKYNEITTLLNEDKFDHDSPVFKATDKNNVATPIQLNKLLEKIQLRDGINNDAAKESLNILIRQQLKQRIPFRLPPTTKVAHKTGTVGGTVNDSGIIYLPDNKGTIIISVLSADNPSMNAGAEVISKVAQAAYEHYTK